jgi:hypothetical protein
MPSGVRSGVMVGVTVVVGVSVPVALAVGVRVGVGVQQLEQAAPQGLTASPAHPESQSVSQQNGSMPHTHAWQDG